MSDDNLFRPEAAQSLKPRLEGDVMALSPLSMRQLVPAMGLVFLLALGFASMASYSAYVPATGMLAPKDGLAQVRARNEGTLHSLTAAVGQEVFAGRVLGIVDKQSYLEDGALAPEVATRLLAHRKSVLELETHARVNAQLAQARGLETKARALETALASAHASLAAAQQALAVSKEQLARNARLVDAGSSSKSAQEDLVRAVLDRETSLRQQEQGLSQLRSDIAASKAAAAEAFAQAEITRAASMGNAAQLDAERLTLSSAAKEAVVAPLHGRVVAVPAKPGPVRAGELVAVIAPTGELMAHLMLPDAAAARARVGQAVSLRLQGQPSRSPVQLTGSIQSISEASVSLDPADNASGFPCLVKLDPPRNTDDAQATELMRRPGARVDARIQVETHTLLGWVVEPFRRGLTQVSAQAPTLKGAAQ